MKVNRPQDVINTETSQDHPGQNHHTIVVDIDMERGENDNQTHRGWYKIGI